MCSYQEHAERFPHDAVEEVEGGVSCHHEEVGQEEELSAAVVQQGVVLAAKQRLIGVLEQRGGESHSNRAPGGRSIPLFITEQFPSTFPARYGISNG